MGRPHLLVVPYPAQGHVMPLMEFSHNLVSHGFRITFVNSDFNHKRVVEATSTEDNLEEFIDLVSLPDGMEEEDRTDLGELTQRMRKVMPAYLEELINKIDGSENVEDKIVCVVADLNQGWVLKIAEKMGIPRAVLWPASSMTLATIHYIPKLIEEGIISTDGIPTKNELIKLSSTMPAMNTAHFIWTCMGDVALQKSVFGLLVDNNPTMELADYALCNSFYELEPWAFALLPDVKPIGPLMASSRLGHFWPEDSTCLNWLDEQPSRSVLYVAFGSHTVLVKRQFDELALGLELSGKRFLWVVRPDLTEATDIFPDGFEKRMGPQGRMVGWAPQREVLAHSSVGGFLTHCGWNSTMEGLSAGVPLLCWPYFADQLLNRSYICDVWKTGLELNPDGNGFIPREEISMKVLQLLGDPVINENAMKYKGLAMNTVNDGGVSLKNFEDFVQWLERRISK